MARAVNVVSLGGNTMGTTWSVRFVPSLHLLVADIDRAVNDELDLVIGQMSPWIGSSDISRFNHADADSWHDLPAEFFEVLSCARDIAQTSNGAYDPTIGVLVDLWGFGPKGRRDSIPAADEIASARGHCGWQRLAFDGRARRAHQPGGMHLDFSSIAKGYAVDRVAARLSALGIVNHLVEIGGELRGRGMKPDGTPWWGALEQLSVSSGNRSATMPETIVALHELSIATSGDSQRRFEVEGRLLSHTLDPRSGYPISDRVASVTVLHPQCMLADAWATALTVLGPEEGLRIASERSLAARFVLRSAGGLQEVATPAFLAMLD